VKGEADFRVVLDHYGLKLNRKGNELTRPIGATNSKLAAMLLLGDLLLRG
jgi:hypothetical protein